MGLFVFLLIVEMLLELRLIRKYSKFQLPEEVDFLTKVAFKLIPPVLPSGNF